MLIGDAHTPEVLTCLRLIRFGQNSGAGIPDQANTIPDIVQHPNFYVGVDNRLSKWIPNFEPIPAGKVAPLINRMYRTPPFSIRRTW